MQNGQSKNEQNKNFPKQIATLPLDCLYIPFQLIAAKGHQSPGEQILYGLYDTDGILRFMGGDRESCMAYAELFELPSIECCLLPLPELSPSIVRGQKRVHRAMSNS